MTDVKPLGMRVLVKRSNAVKTQGEIYLPETAQEKPKQGEIIAVGPGKMDDKGKLIPLEVNTGDKIYFSSYAGTEIKIKEEEGYLIMSQDDILCVGQ